jgi:hypothetical protein
MLLKRKKTGMVSLMLLASLGLWETPFGALPTADICVFFKAPKRLMYACGSSHFTIAKLFFFLSYQSKNTPKKK